MYGKSGKLSVHNNLYLITYVNRDILRRWIVSFILLGYIYIRLKDSKYIFLYITYIFTYLHKSNVNEDEEEEVSVWIDFFFVIIYEKKKNRYSPCSVFDTYIMENICIFVTISLASLMTLIDWNRFLLINRRNFFFYRLWGILFLCRNSIPNRKKKKKNESSVNNKIRFWLTFFFL